LSAVLSAGREALSKNDLAVIQTTEPSDAGIVVITTLAHKSGEWIRGKLCMTPVKNDPQGIGSCITYARRYALSAIVGIAQVDDDGNTASGKDKKPITDDQARDLEARITDNDINMEAVKKWMRASLKVEHFADLNEAGYKAVMHKVDATIKAKK